jgi:hypothetical protein
MKYGAVAVLDVTLFVIIIVMLPSLALVIGYEKRHVILQTYECGDYRFPVNVICSNLNSQAQGDENNLTMTTEAPTNPITESDTNFGPQFLVKERQK